MNIMGGVMGFDFLIADFALALLSVVAGYVSQL